MNQNNRKINARRLKASKLPDVASNGMALCLSAALLLASPLACAQTRDDYCGATPAPGFDQPPNKARSGRYVNKVYGYSLTIPAGFAAFTRPGGPERGFIIELSAAPRATLSVDASYDAFYDITAAGVHRRDLNTISLHDAVIGDEAAD